MVKFKLPIKNLNLAKQLILKCPSLSQTRVTLLRTDRHPCLLRIPFLLLRHLPQFTGCQRNSPSHTTCVESVVGRMVAFVWDAVMWPIVRKDVNGKTGPRTFRIATLPSFWIRRSRWNICWGKESVKANKIDTRLVVRVRMKESLEMWNGTRNRSWFRPRARQKLNRVGSNFLLGH